MAKLEKMCLDNIANSLLNMPELMREKITGVYEIKITELAQENAKKDANKIILHTMKYFGYIITYIFEDMIDCMKDPNKYRQDYHAVFSQVDKDIVDIAYQSADNMFCNYGTNIVIGDNHMQRYVERGSVMQEIHSFESNSEEDYDY